MLKIQTPIHALEAFNGIAFYKNFLLKKPGKILYQLICQMAGRNTLEQKSSWADLFTELTTWAEMSQTPSAGNLWQNYLLDCLILSVNPFTRMASSNAPKPALMEIIRSAARMDYKKLQVLLELDFPSFLPQSIGHEPYLKLMNQKLDWEKQQLPENSPQQLITDTKKALLNNPNPDHWLQILLDFHKKCGNGLFCKYHALRWDGLKKELVGIAAPDPIRLDKLIGYENEREQVLQNTLRLISGQPASNILLYGDRGTGKSSTVKAILNEFGVAGLRMIELPKPYLGDYPLILSILKDYSLTFILFLDDLSFEDHDEDYKSLKSMLEGSLQMNPQHVVIYATSNRRHLIREYFDERRAEIGRLDTVQEKLSLSDRFGVSILFPSPDQELYLKIVEELAVQEGIDLSPQQLRQRALEWELWHNSRSGRTARQFINQLLP